MENYKSSKIGRETAQKYGDILEMERPQTEESLHKHPRMPLQNRAKIFSPFSPLRGYDEQLAAEKQRTERVTKRILTEEEMSALSDKLMQVTKGMTSRCGISRRIPPTRRSRRWATTLPCPEKQTASTRRSAPCRWATPWCPLMIWWRSEGRVSWTLMRIWASGKNEMTKNAERDVYRTALSVK